MGVVSEMAEDRDEAMVPEPPEGEIERCHLCLGSGECPECHGSGEKIERLERENKQYAAYIKRNLHRINDSFERDCGHVLVGGF